MSLSCPECNAYKGSDIASLDRELDDALTPLFHPRRDNWAEHFSLDIDTGRIDPLTGVGRVTVFLLRLNDHDRVVDRKLLIDAQRYPCAQPA
jgi:hypothetical protein